MRRQTAAVAAAVVAASALIAVAMGSFGAETATASGTVQLESTTITGESESGAVDAVVIEPTGTIEWSNFDDGVQEVSVLIGTSGGDVSGADSMVLTPAERGPSGSFTLTESDAPYLRLTSDAFDAGTEGETATTTVPVTVTVGVAGPDGEEATFTRESSVTVEVTNLPDDAGQNVTVEETDSGANGTQTAGNENQTDGNTTDQDRTTDGEIGLNGSVQMERMAPV